MCDVMLQKVSQALDIRFKVHSTLDEKEEGVTAAKQMAVLYYVELHYRYSSV